MKRTAEQTLIDEIASAERRVKRARKRAETAWIAEADAKVEAETASEIVLAEELAVLRATRSLAMLRGEPLPPVPPGIVPEAVYDALVESLRTKSVYVGGDPLPAPVVVALAEIDRSFEEHVTTDEQLEELGRLGAPELDVFVTTAGDAGPEEGTAEVEIVRGGSREKRRRSS